MITSITKRGQTVVPAQIRKKYNIHEMTSLQWIDTGEVIKVIPIPKDVVSELRGSAKGEKLHARLMKERAADAGRD